MARPALLGAFVIVFCIAGLVTGIVRLAPGRDASDLGLAAAATVLGIVAFFFVVRIARRGSAAWTKWLIVPILISAFYVDRLSERDQLALVGLACGYVAALVVTVVIRAVRLTR